MDLYDNSPVDRMWFGTEERMTWIETPQTGADVSSIGQTANEVLLNGGGTVRNSWDSHKVYQYSWGDGASPSLVSLLQAYRNGSYGRGLLYFHDPMYYSTNLLPKRWADPSMAVNEEAESLVPDVTPTASPQVATDNMYPSQAANYSLPGNFDSQADGSELFLPIPPGFTLAFGSVHSGAGQMYYRTPSGRTTVTGLALNAPTVTNVTISGVPWVRLGFFNSLPVPRSITLGGMTARLARSVTSDLSAGPWFSGEGHSGCRFQGNPTVVNYNGVGGGQIGLSAVLQEVGAWE